MGPTRTLGMRLSCNFVNMYTIAYLVQYTFIRVHARSLTDILATILGLMEFKLNDAITLLIWQQ